MEVRLQPEVVQGFRFAGVTAGLKSESGRKDLGIIVADKPASAGSRRSVVGARRLSPHADLRVCGGST